MQNDLDPKGLEAAEAAWSATDMGLTWKLSDAIRAYLSATVPAGDGGLVERLTAEADYLDANLKTFTGPLSTITALRDAASRLSQGTGVTDEMVERALDALQDETGKRVCLVPLRKPYHPDEFRFMRKALTAALSGDTL